MCVCVCVSVSVSVCVCVCVCVCAYESEIGDHIAQSDQNCCSHSDDWGGEVYI